MASSKTPPVYFHFPRQFSLAQRTKLKTFIAKMFQSERVLVADVNYIFCSDDYLLAMNQQYLEHNYFTDIITFNLADKGEPVMGEIYISVDRVIDNARGLGVPFKEEILRVIFHGILHLCGYKDKTRQQVKEMRAKEDYYLKRFLKL